MTRLGTLLLTLVLAPTPALLAACSSDPTTSGAESPETGESPGETAAPEAVPGVVGFRGLTLDLPDDWGSVVHDGCTEVPDRSVVLRAGLAERGDTCRRSVPRDRSWVVVEPLEPDDSILLVMGRGPRVGEERSRTTGLSCRERRPVHCDQAVAVSGLGVLVQLHLVGDGARRALVELRDGLALLNEAYAVVPPVPAGTPVEDAIAAVEAAGLIAEVPSYGEAALATGTVPAAGSVLPEGETVRLGLDDG